MKAYLIFLTMFMCCLLKTKAFLNDVTLGTFCNKQSSTCICDFSTNLVAIPPHSADVRKDIFKRLLFICCQRGVSKLDFKGEIIDQISEDAFSQTACHDIEEISLSKTALTPDPKSLPGDGKAFYGLPNLAKISLANNSKLNRYPDGLFSGLGLSVSELNLNGNPVKTLNGKEFEGLKNLRNNLRIDLSDNSITEIKPKTFEVFTGRGASRSLEELVLDRNKLNTLKPEIFQGLDQLKKLSIAENPIKEIIAGSFMSLKLLEKLVISTPLGDKVTKLEGNSPTLIPTMFYGLVNIRELILEGLGFEQVNVESLYQHSQLNHLSLARNQLKTVPKTALERLAVVDSLQLRTLDLSRNEIACLDHEAFGPFSRLKTLKLDYNLITALGDKAFNGLTNLQELNLMGNPLRFLAPVSLARMKKLKSLEIGPILDLAQKDIKERFPFSALGMLSNSTRIIGLNDLGIYEGGGHSIPLRFDASYNVLSGDCPSWGVPGVDFAWKNVDQLYRDEEIKLDRINGKIKEGNNLYSDKQPSDNWYEVMTSKKYLIIALIVTTSVITILIVVIIIMYRMKTSKHTGSNSSLIRGRKKPGLCGPGVGPNSTSEYGGSGVSGIIPSCMNDRSLYPKYPPVDHMSGYYGTDLEHSICCLDGTSPIIGQNQIAFCTSPQGSQKSSTINKKWNDADMEAALHLAPPPYPQLTRAPHQLLMMNFNSIETVSNASGGTLVSGQHHSLVGPGGSIGSGHGTDSPLAGVLLGASHYNYQSPRNKSASTEQTTTPCTASSLVDEGSAGSGFGLKPFMHYGSKPRNIYSPGSPASSGPDRIGSPICAAGLQMPASNCSSPRHQCCTTTQMLLSTTADFGMV